MKNIIKTLLLSMVVAFATPCAFAMDNGFDPNSLFSDSILNAHDPSFGNLEPELQQEPPVPDVFISQPQSESSIFNNNEEETFSTLFPDLISDDNSKTEHRAKKRKFNSHALESQPESHIDLGYFDTELLGSYQGPTALFSIVSNDDTEDMDTFNNDNNKNSTDDMAQEIVVPQTKTTNSSEQQSNTATLAKAIVAQSTSTTITSSSTSPSIRRKRKRAEMEQDITCLWEGCEKPFNNQNDLYKHVNEHLPRYKELVFRCKWNGCEKYDHDFKEKSNLTKHIRIIHLLEKFECDLCGGKFSLANIKYHRETHLKKEQKLDCPHGCDKYFFKKDFEGHRRLHHPDKPIRTGERSYKCTYEGCNYASAYKKSLTAHTRKHTGERPFKCTHPGCSYAATTSGTLRSHMRTTHGEKPYKCTYKGCSYAFDYNSDLKKHIQTHTGEKSEYDLYICKWDGCNQPLGIDNSREHINKHVSTCQDYVCKWDGCERQGEPFVYGGCPHKNNLIIHIQRHTVKQTQTGVIS